MKKILLILDGIVAKKLLQRIIKTNVNGNSYDVVYLNDQIMPTQRPSNFTFYKFDPTSQSKLCMVLQKEHHHVALIALNSKDDTIDVVKIIKANQTGMHINVLDYWDINLDLPFVNIYKGIDVLANGLMEKLPNVPVLAQNIGLRQGEIMEIRVPFGSSYAYRYIGSIEQVDWKIFGLYRSNLFINVKPSVILKPNDIILVIGKPKVLMQVYNAMSKSEGQFPMPFGHNTYLYLDLYEQKEEVALKAVQEACFTNEKINNKKLIIKITRPSNAIIMNKIKELIADNPTIILEIDYHNIGFKKIIQNDMKRFDVGLLILSYELFKNKEKIASIVKLKIPVLKLGLQKVQKVKDTIVILDDKQAYEQISPIVFDISSQLKTKTKIYNLDPLGAEDKSEILDHFDNLAKIFNQKIKIITDEKNPIRVLREQTDVVQIMPLKQYMFKKRYFKLLYTNSDLIAFDSNRFNQLLIPVVEE